MKTSIILSTALAALTYAKPISSNAPVQKRADPNSIKILETIAPKSVSCTGAPIAAECTTATSAADPLIASFTKYQISTPGEQAALLAWMAMESGEFQYVRNHFPAPGRPGQGTRCMFMPEFVAAYGQTIGVGDGTVPADDAAKTKMLDDIIAVPGGEWGAASWYYTTKCDDATKQAVKSGSQAGFEQFLTTCVQTGVEERLPYWLKAATALGLSGQ